MTEFDYENMTVKGRCRTLDKEYLRLTAPPKAEHVRPEPILRKHLANIKKKWKEKSSGKKYDKIAPKIDYDWFCSQLKAIRQDLTVQRIFNAFAVDAYETHASIALEEGDLNEYNQSQTQLKDLYEKISHRSGSNANGLKNQNEFIAYRVLYNVFMTVNTKYEGGTTDLFKIMLNLTPEQQKHPSIVHALKVRVAVADNDYHAFFHLQDRAPNLGAFLMDFIVPSIRAIGLKAMMKAYRPSMSVDFILSELGFVFHGVIDRIKGDAWLKNCGCKFNLDRTMILTKETSLNNSVLSGNHKSSLI